MTRELGRFVRRLCSSRILPSTSTRSDGSATEAQLIRQLREKSCAPMKDVKAALVQCDWNVETAFTELRKKGLAAISKKASRVASEGLLALSKKAFSAAIVELNSETDFVARNDIFQHLASRVASAALSIVTMDTNNSSQLAALDLQALEAVRIKLEHPKLSCEVTVQDAVKETAAIMGENIKLRRAYQVFTASGIVCSYLHNGPKLGLGRTAGLLTLDFKSDTVPLPCEEVDRMGEKLAMHIVASRPLFLSKESVTPDVWERERSIILSQVAGSNKPEPILNKMVEGRLHKYSEEVVFLEQKFVMDDKLSVQAVLSHLSNEVGGSVTIGSFLRLDVGEHVEREESIAPREAIAQGS